MFETQKIQGRVIRESDIEEIRSLIGAHPDWSRRRISVSLAEGWDWRNATGQLKDMAARSLLLKLDERGLISLPPRQRRGGRRKLRTVAIPMPARRVTGPLSVLRPLSFEVMEAGADSLDFFNSALAQFHYLGYSGPVGHHLGYLVSDTSGRPLACLLFGAAAWRTEDRDRFIGWSDETRAARLHFIANNSRFLILPWVRVAHLASHILGHAMRRLPHDWGEKYAQPLYLVETYVERQRFEGTCYKAANWQCVGSTKGRSRQDRDRTLQVPRKDIYLYALHRKFRHFLCQ